MSKIAFGGGGGASKCYIYIYSDREYMRVRVREGERGCVRNQGVCVRNRGEYMRVAEGKGINDCLSIIFYNFTIPPLLLQYELATLAGEIEKYGKHR